MERKPVSVSPILVGVLLLLVLLPVLYILSVGPMIWLADHDYISKDGNAYAPLQWACDGCEPFNKAVNWYMRFFY